MPVSAAVFEDHRKAYVTGDLIVFVGSGTSATGEIVSEGIYSYRSYDERTVDPNRLAHNEFLRSLYEWGVIGALILSSLVVSTFIKGLRVVRSSRSPRAHAMMAVVLLVTVYLFFENVFAAPGSPLGANLAFALALLSASGIGANVEGVEGDFSFVVIGDPGEDPGGG